MYINSNIRSFIIHKRSKTPKNQKVGDVYLYKDT
jgi:hypothetical protein